MIQIMDKNFNKKRQAAILSLIIGVVLFFAKISAYFLTNSDAIFSDAAESVVHVAATIMALTSIIISSRPPDKKHLYGYGNIEFFSAGIEGLLIIIAAVSIIYYAVLSLLHGSSLNSLDIGTIIIAAAGLINLALGLHLIKEGKKTNSLTLIADGKHVLTDSFTSIGVIIGLVIVLFTGFEIFDPIFAILVALNILYTGGKLVRESIGGLMIETNTEQLEKIEKCLSEIRKDSWIDIHNLRFWVSGEKINIDLHLILPYYFSIKDAHLEEDYISDNLEKIFSNSEVIIHFDYCEDNLCEYCEKQNCSERRKEFIKANDWNRDKFLGKALKLLIEKN